MAWRSSGTNNESMVDNLKRFGVVRTSSVEMAFRQVDRRFFVPRNQISLAHADQPLRENLVHISAPHIYGTALEALEFDAGSSQSFLNLGSGTGYLSCIAANILGPHSVHVAVEVHAETIHHAKESLQLWQNAIPHVKIPPIEMIHGNALCIDTNRGEGATGFDRIYIGATVSRRKLQRIARLLRPGGILVGPVDDDLVKVIRVGEDGGGTSIADVNNTGIPRSLRGHPPMLPSDYSVQILSGVRFAPLVEDPALPTLLPSRIWEPTKHATYPPSFRQACQTILLCAHADYVQPTRAVATNAASILPRALWMEIFSYTTRDWFDKPKNTEDLLRRRLQHEQAALREANEARQQAEARLEMMERERDLYKVLLMRCQTRLRSAVGDSEMATEAALLDGHIDEAPQLLMAADRQGGFLRALHPLRRSIAGNHRHNESDEDDEDDDDDEVQEDIDLAESEDEMEETEIGEERPMEEDDEFIALSAPVVAIRRQARTISLSENDF